MKHEIKHEFKSFGVLTVLSLIGFSVMVIAAPWKHFERDSQTKLALQKAEVVGYQVAQIRRDRSSDLAKSKSPDSRGPAAVSDGPTIKNVGTMGLDPWGQPYHYRILSSDGSKSIRILVWSLGPNQKSENPQLDDEAVEFPKKAAFAGDDLGTILNVYQN